MREIKFRVWDGVDYMSSQFTLNDLQLKVIQFASNCVVMQFIGLKDKNGKEIYEGDVVWVRRSGSNGDRDYLGEISWSDQGACFYVKSGKYHMEIISFAQSGDGEGVWLNNVWIEGNIYENPELLTIQSK